MSGDGSNGRFIIEDGGVTVSSMNELSKKMTALLGTERMSADDVKALVEDTEMGGPLADWKAKGSTVEYLGTEDVDGTPAHKLKVARKNGDVSFVYLDPDHFLEIRIVTQRVRHGAHGGQ